MGNADEFRLHCKVVGTSEPLNGSDGLLGKPTIKEAEMTQEAPNGSTSYTGLVIGGLLISLCVFAVAGFILYSSICPCDRTPGGFLFGERVEPPVSDWSFANEVSLCQIQVWAGIRPHSINLNCMAAADGKLYLSCSFCASKYWAAKVGPNEEGNLRLNGLVYPVLFKRVLDNAELDRAWAARVNKLQLVADALNPAPVPDAQRPDDWWSFNIVSAKL